MSKPQEKAIRASYLGTVSLSFSFEGSHHLHLGHHRCRTYADGHTFCLLIHYAPRLREVQVVLVVNFISGCMQNSAIAPLRCTLLVTLRIRWQEVACKCTALRSWCCSHSMRDQRASSPQTSESAMDEREMGEKAPTMTRMGEGPP